MSFRLTKPESKQLAECRAQLSKLRLLIVKENIRLHHELSEVARPLNDLIRRYNDALREARLFTSTIAEKCRDEFEAKSDAWKEGERGQAAAAFIDEWDKDDMALDDLDEVEVVTPDSPDVPVDPLGELPEEADA